MKQNFKITSICLSVCEGVSLKNLDSFENKIGNNFYSIESPFFIDPLLQTNKESTCLHTFQSHNNSRIPTNGVFEILGESDSNIDIGNFNRKINKILNLKNIGCSFLIESPLLQTEIKNTEHSINSENNSKHQFNLEDPSIKQKSSPSPHSYFFF